MEKLTKLKSGIQNDPFAEKASALASHSTERPRLVVAITGASGVILGIRLLELARELALETHLVVSPAAHLTIQQETNLPIEDVLCLADVVHNYGDIAASIASGSFTTHGMVVIPCSIKTLSGIANSYAEDLITRAADVTLKEGRPLVLVVREAPLHRGHIRLMQLACDAGAIIFPPVPAFYASPIDIDALVTNIAGRVLARLGFDNQQYRQWTGLTNPDDE
jgi:4-hydroxy-3-polyprenylbenzoate decarboxylase